VTWTYSDPSANDRDKVRFKLGDTDTSDELISDEEIAYLLTLGTVQQAAAHGAEAIAARFARKADKTIGDLALKLSQKAEAYWKLAAALWEDAGGKLPSLELVPYAGGISVSDKEAVEEDSDRVEPAFRRDVGFFDTEDS
jgi:hypothetical protein